MGYLWNTFCDKNTSHFLHKAIISDLKITRVVSNITLLKHFWNNHELYVSRNMTNYFINYF